MIDLCFVRNAYSPKAFELNDFIGPLGAWEIHLNSGPPKERNDYLKIFRPFNPLIWVCLVGALVIVFVSLVIINEAYGSFSNSRIYESHYQSMYQDFKTSVKVWSKEEEWSLTYFPALTFCIGAVIEEAQEDSYIARRSCSKARKLLVLKWMIVGFFLTISYKSVLRSILIKIDYEKPMDTIEDMVRSDMPIRLARDTILSMLLATDPRESVRSLAEKIVFYEFGTKYADEDEDG